MSWSDLEKYLLHALEYLLKARCPWTIPESKDGWIQRQYCILTKASRSHTVFHGLYFELHMGTCTNAGGVV